jgi:hypothetical protein
MKTQDYTTTIQVSTSTKNTIEAIDRVNAWWTASFEGSAHRPGDTFTVRFGDTFVVFEVAQHAEDRIVWHVKESLLPWLRDKSEWTDTDVVWQLTARGGETMVQMTHEGLVPSVECYSTCERGWDFYVGKSLRQLLTEGAGLPDAKTRDHA